MNPPELNSKSPAAATTTAHGTARTPWLAFLLAGIIGGLIAGVGLVRVNNVFQPPTDTPAAGSNDPALATFGVAMEQAQQRNAVLSAAWLGLIVAASIGIAAGLALGSVRALLSAAVIGAVVGAALGTAAGFFMQWLLARFPNDESTAMYRILAAHAVVFGSAGIASAVAVAAARGRAGILGRGVLLGALGGVAAAVVFIPVGVPLSFVAIGNPDQPIPEGTAYQIAWGVVGGMLIGAVLASLSASESDKSTGAGSAQGAA